VLFPVGPFILPFSCAPNVPARPTSSADQRIILLVEAYDAVAAAVAAALRKFAPDHTVRVRRSLADGEASAIEDRPDVLVIDVDPPHGGALEFFNRIKLVAPWTRVLIIAPSVPQETLRARTRPCAFQFIEKPFELPAFGAALQALTAAPQRPSDLPSLGTIRDLNLADIIPLQCLSGDATIVTVEQGRRRGEIHFARGKLVHAVTERSEGIIALERMMNWSSPRFAVSPLPDGSPRRIRAPWHSVLLDVLHAMPETEPQVTESSITETPPEPTPTAAGPVRKIVVIDDTEMLRIFVEEMLKSANPNLQVVTAANATEGLRSVIETKPDLLLLDYSLPDFNGDEVCRRLLADEETARLPVIMMSGHVPEMTAAAEQFRNIVATLAKPFLSPALIELVTKTLEHPPVIDKRATAAPPSAPAAPPPAVETPPPPTPAPPAAAHDHGGNGHAPPAAPTPPPEEPSPPAPPTPTATLLAPSPRARLPVSVAPGALPLEHARIARASSNAVIVGMTLEVVSMQFTATLQMAAIRARPVSRSVALHIDPAAMPATALPEAGFELNRVDLDARGQIAAMRLVPDGGRIAHASSRTEVPISSIAVLQANGGGGAVQLTPSAAEPMKIELLAAFDLVGVELSSSFSVNALVLRARQARMRVSFDSGILGARTGATFESAQVLLDRSARIAEILLDAVA
jgi:CheY-like chemotaxis protein